MDLLSWIFGNHGYDQDKKLYIHTDNPERSFSASQARTTVKKLIAGLQAKGLKPGDCVCVYAFNDVLYSMLVLGIIGAGGRFTGCNPAYTASELGHQIRLTRARFLITEPEVLSKVATAVESFALSPSSVFVLDNTDKEIPIHWNSIQDLFKHGETDWVKCQTVEEARHTTAALLLTSGTTGLPKAARISHYCFVMMNLTLNDSARKPYEVSRLISLPMFHMYAFPLAHIAPLREGITTYIMRRFDLDRYLALIEEKRITETPMVPAMINSIVKSLPNSNSTLQSLRLVWSAGAILDAKLQDQMYRLLQPSARVLQIWGMTEAGYITGFLFPETDYTGSVGRILPGVETKLVAEDGTIVTEDHTEAEIYVRGSLVMQGYLEGPEASSNGFDDDGWLKTGDIGYTEHGKYYLVDRKKGLIKVRGWQVSPAELELVLMRHPDILEAAVVGIKLPNSTDEAPRAYIVKKLGSNLNESVVRTHMSLYLAKYKTLDGGIVFTGSIPRTPAGKVSRKVLRERAESESKERMVKDLILLALSSMPHFGTAASGTAYDSDRASSVDPNSLATSGYLEADGHSLRATTTRSSVYSDANSDESMEAALKTGDRHSFDIDASRESNDTQPVKKSSSIGGYPGLLADLAKPHTEPVKELEIAGEELALNAKDMSGFEDLELSE